MSRTVMNYAIDKPDDFIQFVAADFFAKEGFRLVNYKGEQVWKHGTGFLVAPSFIKLQWGGGQLHLEVWIKSFGEHDLEGFYGAIPKANLRSRVDTLLGLLYQNVPDQNAVPAAQPAYAAPAPQPAPAPEQPVYEAPAVQAAPASQPAPIPVAVHNPTGQATASLITGLCGLIGIWIPLIGMILGIVAICTGLRGRHSTSKGMATAGLVLGIIFLVLSVLMWIVNVLFLML